MEGVFLTCSQLAVDFMRLVCRCPFFYDIPVFILNLEGCSWDFVVASDVLLADGYLGHIVLHDNDTIFIHICCIHCDRSIFSNSKGNAVCIYIAIRSSGFFQCISFTNGKLIAGNGVVCSIRSPAVYKFALCILNGECSTLNSSFTCDVLLCNDNILYRYSRCDCRCSGCLCFRRSRFCGCSGFFCCNFCFRSCSGCFCCNCCFASGNFCCGGFLSCSAFCCSGFLSCSAFCCSSFLGCCDFCCSSFLGCCDFCCSSFLGCCDFCCSGCFCGCFFCCSSRCCRGSCSCGSGSGCSFCYFWLFSITNSNVILICIGISIVIEITIICFAAKCILCTSYVGNLALFQRKGERICYNQISLTIFGLKFIASFL